MDGRDGAVAGVSVRLRLGLGVGVFVYAAVVLGAGHVLAGVVAPLLKAVGA